MYKILLIIVLISCSKNNYQQLRVLESYSLPIREISGMSWRVDPKNSKKQIAIIGDHDNYVYLLDWESRKDGLDLKKIDLQKLSSEKLEGGWESIASDATGRLFLLQEEPSRIIVLNKELNKIIHNIELVITDHLKDSLQWGVKKNSAAEGITLLKNGHILITKEKKPFRLVEFTNRKNQALGYNKKLSLENKGVFPLSSKSKKLKLYSNYFWKLKLDDEEKLKDVSGINIDNNNEVYLLSDKSHVISHLGDTLSVDKDTLELKKVYALPDEFDKAEGMVIDLKKRAIIGVDKKATDKKNIFLLSPFI